MFWCSQKHVILCPPILLKWLWQRRWMIPNTTFQKCTESVKPLESLSKKWTQTRNLYPAGLDRKCPAMQFSFHPTEGRNTCLRALVGADYRWAWWSNRLNFALQGVKMALLGYHTLTSCLFTFSAASLSISFLSPPRLCASRRSRPRMLFIHIHLHLSSPASGL